MTDMKIGSYFTSLLIIISFSIFNLANCISLLAQEDDQIWYNVVSVPPSPNAAALGKYGEIPVDKSTGIPNISIPILDLNEGGIDLSISLSYHAGGIRVQDEASWVGLGWSLNAGGVITRTMRGLPDDQHLGFLQYCDRIPLRSIIANELITPLVADSAYERLDEIAKGYVDYEPDLFYYNYNGKSGSFMFGNHRQIVNIPYDNVKIKPFYSNIGEITGFMLFDPSGLVYIFGLSNDRTETTHVNIREIDPEDYISSWYLKQIINPYKNFGIVFEYDAGSTIETTNYSYSKTYQNGTWGYEFFDGSETQSTTEISVKYLKRILLNNGVVSFLSSNSNDGGRKLDSISFVTPFGGGRKFKLNYDYFKVTQESNEENELRLRLLSVVETIEQLETSISDISEKKYSFDYLSPNLPSKTSSAVDYWGFYNGKINNVTTIPKIEYGIYEFGDADRDPNPETSSAAVLSRITYPTGGYSEFKYQNNAYGRFPTPEEISTDVEPQYVYVTGEEIHTENCQFESIAFDTAYGYTNFYLHAELTVDSNYEETPHGRIQLISDLAPGPPDNIIFEKELIGTDPVIINLGDLDLENFIGINVCAEGSMTHVLGWVEYQSYDPDELDIKREYPAGGLRIEQINNYDHLTKKINFKSFEYNKSGYFNTSLPTYYTQTSHMWCEWTPPPIPYCDLHLAERLFVYSSPVGGLGNSSNSVSYEQVKEYSGTPSNNSGKIVTTFVKYEDDPIGGTPYFSHFSHQYLRSKILNEVYYKNEDQDYVMAKKIDFQYTYDTNHVTLIHGFKASRIMTLNVYNHFIDYYDDEFAFENFTTITYNNRLSEKITHDFTSGGGEIVTKESFYYDNIHHLNPTRTLKTNSDGNEIKTIYKYPFDYISCFNNCDKVYEDLLDSCNVTFSQELASDLGHCRSLYFPCWAQFVADVEWRNNNCYASSNDVTNFHKIFHPDRNCKYMKEIREELEDCLNTSGYKECVDEMDRGYIPCLIEADLEYNNCIDDYYMCIDSLYYASSDPFERGIYLLASWNFQNTLIEKIVYSDEEEIEHFKFNFNEDDSTQKPILVNVQKEINNSDFTTEIRYDAYDNNLNILQTTPFEKGNSDAYIWGYDNLYPVIFGKNVTFEILNSAVNATHDSLYYLLNTVGTLKYDNQKAEWNHFNSTLRNNPLLTNAQISTYTYMPFIGITSKTDPNGISTFYEYDVFGRLTDIRDNDSKIVQHFSYNYQQDQIEFDPASINFPYSGGSSSIIVTSNTEWHIEEDIPWLSISPQSGTYSGEITIYAQANSDTASRTVEISAVCNNSNGFLTINQDGTPYLNVSPLSVTFFDVGGKETISVNSNVSWQVGIQERDTWIKLEHITNSSFEIICEPYSGPERSIKVWVQDTDQVLSPIDIEVIQK